jgi:hypothetical protein
MSNAKKVVKIKENELVDLIENIVNEALLEKKKEWVNEQAAKGNKTPLLEQKIDRLEKLVSKMVKTK